MSTVKRVYVEKKPDYAVKAKELHDEIKNYLNIDAEYVRVLVRYDIENLSEETYKKALVTVFSEPPIDMIYEGDNLPMADTDKVFSVEFLPGQFDQRADSAEQCVKLLNEDEDPIIRPKSQIKPLYLFIFSSFILKLEYIRQGFPLSHLLLLHRHLPLPSDQTYLRQFPFESV